VSLELPPVHQASLAWSVVDELFDDLAALAQHVEVRLKLVGRARAEAGTTDLAGARRALVDGSAIGAQIRYVHAGQPWCDTLVREAEGLRLIRMASPLASPQGERT
jgi:hypothetical protein